MADIKKLECVHITVNLVKKAYNNAVHVVKCWTIRLLSTATEHHLHCACNPTGS